MLASVRVPYPEAIPDLLDALESIENRDIEGAIVRALSVSYAGETAFRKLAARLRQRIDKLDRNLQYSYGLALFATAPREAADDMRAIAEAIEFREARRGPVRWLARTLGDEAKPYLLTALQDEVVAEEAIDGLRHIKAWDTIGLVESMVQNPRDGVRDAAKKFLSAAKKYRQRRKR